MRYIAILSVLLLSVSWAVAQDPQNKGEANPATPTESTESQVRSGAALEHLFTVEGCLAGSDGGYTLSDKKGATYQLVGDTSKLAAHVGQQVKVEGHVKGTSGAGTSNSGKTVSSGGTGMETTPINVKSVKQVSETCKTNGGMSK
jgi:hypothetical protein